MFTQNTLGPPHESVTTFECPRIFEQNFLPGAPLDASDESFSSLLAAQYAVLRPGSFRNGATGGLMPLMWWISSCCTESNILSVKMQDQLSVHSQCRNMTQIQLRFDAL